MGQYLVHHEAYASVGTYHLKHTTCKHGYYYQLTHTHDTVGHCLEPCHYGIVAIIHSHYARQQRAASQHYQHINSQHSGNKHYDIG